jgi:hypothetical protein
MQVVCTEAPAETGASSLRARSAKPSGIRLASVAPGIGVNFHEKGVPKSKCVASGFSAPVQTCEVSRLHSTSSPESPYSCRLELQRAPIFHKLVPVGVPARISLLWITLAIRGGMRCGKSRTNASYSVDGCATTRASSTAFYSRVENPLSPELMPLTNGPCVAGGKRRSIGTSWFRLLVGPLAQAAGAHRPHHFPWAVRRAASAEGRPRALWPRLDGSP